MSKTGWIDKGAVDGCSNGTGNGVGVAGGIVKHDDYQGF